MRRAGLWAAALVGGAVAGWLLCYLSALAMFNTHRVLSFDLPEGEDDEA